MNVAAHDAVVAVGQQVSVITQNFPKLAGIVRWTAAGMFGVQFSQPITEQLIEKMAKFSSIFACRGRRVSRLNCPAWSFSTATAST